VKKKSAAHRRSRSDSEICKTNDTGIDFFGGIRLDSREGGVCTFTRLERSLRPALYRRSLTRERTATGHGINFEEPKTINRDWWLPIQIQREYTEMLMRPGWKWDIFGHLTFREPIHPESADKVFTKWLHIINRQIFGVRYWNRKKTDGVLSARGLEMQKREVIHFHFLMSRIPGEMHRLWMMAEWSKLAGYARIHPFVAGMGGEAYICKYATKRGDIEFGGPVELMPKE
jgi:hypothetical protein